MNTAAYVDDLIKNWKVLAMPIAEMVQNIAVACIGWPYVYGEWGATCTPGTRRTRANGIEKRIPAEAKVIRNTCQVLRASSPQPDCLGCKYYPDGKRVRCYDCRGFTHWLLMQVGIDIKGQGATSQWDTNANWLIKGPISQIPMDKVCVVFMWDSKKQNMSHTGLHIGNGDIVHCSGEVKYGKITDKGWTHYAIPAGLEGSVSPVPVPITKPILKSGSVGEYVVEAQKKLIEAGYDLGNSGADGKFGAKTAAAVKAFQKVSGLKADGIIGKDTWAALDKVDEDAKPVIPLYTVTIKHLSKEKAEELVTVYAPATMIKE